MRKLLVLILMLGCSFTTGTGASAAVRKYVGPPGYHQEKRQPGEERRWLEERRRQEEERRKKEEARRKKEEERRRQEEERRRKEEERRRIEEDRRRQEDDRRWMEDDRRRQEEQRRKAEDRWRWQEDNRRQRRPIYPQPPYWKPQPRTSGEQFRAKQVLRETADYLIRAQRAARNGYGNGLGMAYTHQQQAQKLYYQGRYQSSIGHSMRARFIAGEIIRYNQVGRRPGPGGPPPYRPSYDNLDDELSIRIIDDNIAIRLKIDLD